MRKLIFITLLSFFCAQLLAIDIPKDKDDVFLVKVFDQSIKVTSPPKHLPFLSIIVENNTLVTLLGKVQTSTKNVIGFITVKPNSFQSLPLRIKEGERIFFIPMAPPFQEVELIIGNKTYEIPPKR
jgi:hypothetical protein